MLWFVSRYRKVVSNNCTGGVMEQYTARRQVCPSQAPRGLHLVTSEGRLTANLASNVTFLVFLEEVYVKQTIYYSVSLALKLTWRRPFVFSRAMDREPASVWTSETETPSPTPTWARSKTGLNTSTRTWESTACPQQPRTVWALKPFFFSCTSRVSLDLGEKALICLTQTAITYSAFISLMYLKDALGPNSFMVYWPEKSHLALVVLYSTLTRLGYKLTVSNWTKRLKSSFLVIADRHFGVPCRSRGPKTSSRPGCWRN